MSRFPLVVLSAILVSACGGSNNNSTISSSDVAVRFSDAPVDGASNVVITVDSMTFRHTDGEEIVVDTFTSDELGVSDAETFTIDLLEVRGSDNRLVLDSVDLPVGEYSDLRLNIMDEDTNLTYVIESENGAPKALKIPSDELKLGGFTVSALSTQTFVIEFGLRQAMTYNPGPDRYLLKPRGVRIVELEAASAIEGTVDLAAAHSDAACAEKPDTSVGNAVYVYPGHGLATESLTDDADPLVAPRIETDGLTVPYASSMISDDNTFDIAYLPPGNYTVAFSCLAENDQPETIEDIAVPNPATDIVEVTVTAGERANCQFVSGTQPACTVASGG